MWQTDGTPQSIVVVVRLRPAVIPQREFPRLVEIGHHPLCVEPGSTAKQNGQEQSSANHFCEVCRGNQTRTVPCPSGFQGYRWPSNMARERVLLHFILFEA